MNQTIFIQLSEITLFVLLGSGIIAVMLAALYDIGGTKNHQRVSLMVRRLQKSRQPWVTVLVYARDNAATLVTCLASIEQSYYHHYDIVVVDNKSSDMTRQAVMRYRQRHPQSSCYFFYKRKYQSRVQALRQGYAKSAKGELVLVVSASAVITPTVLKASVARFVSNKAPAALRLRDGASYVEDITSLLSQFSQLSMAMYRKCAAVLHLNIIRIGETGVLYHAMFLRGRQNQTWVRCSYASEIVVRTGLPMPPKLIEGNRMLWLLARVVYGIGTISIICLMTYAMYIAATLQSSSLLVLSWLMVSLWFVSVIWSDETTRWPQKVARTWCVPILYFIVYFELLLPVNSMYRQRMYKRRSAIF